MPLWDLIIIVSGNGLVPDGTNPSRATMLFLINETMEYTPGPPFTNMV